MVHFAQRQAPTCMVAIQRGRSIALPMLGCSMPASCARPAASGCRLDTHALCQGWLQPWHEQYFSSNSLLLVAGGTLAARPLQGWMLLDAAHCWYSTNASIHQQPQQV